MSYQPMEWVPRVDPKTGVPTIKKSYSVAHGVLYGFEDCRLVPKGSKPELMAWWSRLPQIAQELDAQAEAARIAKVERKAIVRKNAHSPISRSKDIWEGLTEEELMLMKASTTTEFSGCWMMADFYEEQGNLRLAKFYAERARKSKDSGRLFGKFLSEARKSKEGISLPRYFAL